MATEDGIRAQATLKKLFDKRQQELDSKQTELAKARDDIEKQSRVLSREALQKRMEDWQRRMVELQTVFVDYNKTLQKKQGELTAPIIKKMMAVINRLAKRNGYELILDKQATPYVRPDLDLTDQVIQLYNSGGDPGEPAAIATGDSVAGEERVRDARNASRHFVDIAHVHERGFVLRRDFPGLLALHAILILKLPFQMIVPFVGGNDHG